jgi:hypothetical protein
MIDLNGMGAKCPHIPNSVAYIKIAHFSIFLIFEIYIINMNKKEQRVLSRSPGD